MFSQPPESECYTAFSSVGLYIAINNTLSCSIKKYLTSHNNVMTAIAVMFHKHFITVSECFRDFLT